MNNKAYVESVPVEVADGEFRITFAQPTENPAIKAIELAPDSADKDSDEVYYLRNM